MGDWDSRGGGFGGGGGYGGGGGGGGFRSGSYNTGSGARDGDSEYIRLSQKVASNIRSIQSSSSQLKRMGDLIGTPRDVHELRQRLHHVLEDTGHIITSTRDDLKQLARLDGGMGGESRKRQLQQEKLSKDFKGVLENWQRESSTVLRKEKETVRTDRERAASFRSMQRDTDDYGGRNEAAQPLMGYDDQHQNHQLDDQIEYNQSVIQEREQGIMELESQMTEVNEIFRDLGTLVSEQGHVLDNIEANITVTEDYVESGTEQLVKASNYQKKARKKMCCLLVVVVVAAAVLTIILVTQLKK